MAPLDLEHGSHRATPPPSRAGLDRALTRHETKRPPRLVRDHEIADRVALPTGPIGFPGSSATLGFIIALTGVSLVVLALATRGRASGFSGFLVVTLSMLLLASSAASRVEVRDGVGDRTWTPVPATGSTSFELGAGEATLDLSRLDTDTPRATPQQIQVEMGAGDLIILVPPGLDARVDASVGIGSIRHTGSSVVGVNESSGTDRSTSTVLGDEPVQVVVDAQLGLGQITIQEQ